MMFWYGNGMNGWGYALMAVVMIAVLVLIVLSVVVVARALIGPPRPPAPPPPDTPESLLAQRLARGEIDEDEYRRKLALLANRRSPGQEGR